MDHTSRPFPASLVTCSPLFYNTYHDYAFFPVGNVRGLVARKKLAPAQAEKALSMVTWVLDYSQFKDVDMVIEVCSSLNMLIFY